MIDFNLDEPEEQLPSDPAPERPGVIGLGQAGINVLDQMVMHGTESFGFLAIDTDYSVVEGSVSPEKLLFGTRVARGLGCTGDVLRGAQIWKSESSPLESFFKLHRQVVIIAGLGGGTGSSFALEAARMAQLNGVKVFVLCTLPFSFETGTRQEVARRTLRQLRTVADGVLTMSNDNALGWPCSNENIRQSYHVLNQLMAHGAEAVVQILHNEGIPPLELADLHRMFGERDLDEVMENFWIGCGEVEMSRGIEELVDNVLESPLLEDKNSWQEADACLACLTGGDGISLAHAQQVSKYLEKRLGKRVKVKLGARPDSSNHSKLRLILLLASTRSAPQVHSQKVPIPVVEPTVVKMTGPIEAIVSLPEPVEPGVNQVLPGAEKGRISTARRSKSKRALVETDEVTLPSEAEEEFTDLVNSGTKKKASRQEELPFESNRGRFDKSHETIYRGENLDQPTFRRRKLEIKV